MLSPSVMCYGRGMQSDDDAPIRWEFGERMYSDAKVYWLPFILVHAVVLLWMHAARAVRKGSRRLGLTPGMKRLSAPLLRLPPPSKDAPEPHDIV